MKNTHGRVLLLIKLQALTCNFTKSNTPPWVFFMFFKLYKWYKCLVFVHFRTWIFLQLYSNSFFSRCSPLWQSYGLRTWINPLSAKQTIWSNASQPLIGKSWQMLFVFDHFVRLVLKGLRTTFLGSEVFFLKETLLFKLKNKQKRAK